VTAFSGMLNLFLLITSNTGFNSIPSELISTIEKVLKFTSGSIMLFLTTSPNVLQAISEKARRDVAMVLSASFFKMWVPLMLKNKFVRISFKKID